MPPRRRSTPRSPQHAALGEAIRRLRADRGLSQEELADRVETDFTQIGGIERGRGNPSYSTLLRLADALETRPGEIVGLADRVLEEEGAERDDDAEDQRVRAASAQTASTTRSHSSSTPRTQQ
jgi:transcriptional regulator with XRE-family HTH domain